MEAAIEVTINLHQHRTLLAPIHLIRHSMPNIIGIFVPTIIAYTSRLHPKWMRNQGTWSTTPYVGTSRNPHIDPYSVRSTGILSGSASNLIRDAVWIRKRHCIADSVVAIWRHVASRGEHELCEDFSSKFTMYYGVYLKEEKWFMTRFDSYPSCTHAKQDTLSKGVGISIHTCSAQ